jgi:polyisoprenoid-binding protein YceI
VAISPGTHTLGPADGTLAVRTERSGAAAKAGHNLLIHVTDWQATLEVDESSELTSVALDANSTSLRVQEGSGGMQALGDDDKEGIAQTIDEEVLKTEAIAFRSTAVQAAAGGSPISVEGELTLVGTTRPLVLELAIAPDGRISGSTVIKQTDWQIKPYSTLFGALKVVDEVTVTIDARLPLV